MTLIKKIVAYALVLVLFHAEVGYSFPFRNPRPLQGSHWLTLTPGCHQKLARKYKKNPHTKSSIGRKLLYPLLLSGGLVGGCMLYEQCSMPPDRASSVDYDANSLGEKSIKVVTIGDSLTTSFSVKGGDLSSILQSRLKPKNENWALDDREENSIHSEYERLDSVPREFINISTPRASVDDPGVFHNSIPTKLIMKVSDLSDQVYQTASLKPFPNIIQIWIGNNNIDWVYEVKTLTKLPKDYDVYVDPFKIADRHRKKMVEAVLKKYKEELHKLILKANIQKYNVAIVVFSLPNIDSYLEGMDRAMALHQKDEKNFQIGRAHV